MPIILANQLIFTVFFNLEQDIDILQKNRNYKDIGYAIDLLLLIIS